MVMGTLGYSLITRLYPLTLPYTLGCLPPSKNRAGFPTPNLPFPTRAGDKGDQVRPVPHRLAGGNLVSRSLAAGPEAE